MSSVGLRPPQFSEDLAWLPGWLQHLTSEGSIEPIKSQISSKQAVKDLDSSQENGEDVNALSREEGRYNSCHLFLSGEDSSPVSFFPSSENVLHFSLRLSSDVDSVFCPTLSLNASHDVFASSKRMSIQLVENSVESRENRHSMMECNAPEQNLLPPSISETVKNDSSESPSDKAHYVRQHKNKTKVKSIEGSDINDAIELSIAASEALVIHDLVKMGSVSETIPTEAVLEVALHVKQARLEGLEDGFHSSNEESDWSDSLSDLNDFTMADAYDDVGLSRGVFSEKNHCSSAVWQEKDIFVAENHYGFENELSETALRSHLVNFHVNSCKEELGVNVEVEMQLKPDSPLEWLRHDRKMDSYDPGLGPSNPVLFKNGVPIVHQTIENNSNILATNQTVGLPMADMTSDKPQNSVDSSLDGSGNLRKENSENFMVPRKFRSRWLGGWTCKELDSPSPDRIPNFFIRETSFLSESADIVPDETSFVKKHDSQCGIGSQSSIPFEGLRSKADDSIMHSQDVALSSSSSFVDPLCSVVPCSIGSEYANSKTQSDEKIDTEKFVPDTPEYGVDNFQRTSDQNIKVDFKNGNDITFSITETVVQLPENLNIVEQASRKQLNSLKSYSMIEPDQSFNLQCNWALLPTDQNIVGALSSDKKSSESHSVSKCAYGNKNEENHENSVNHKSIKEITHEKRSDYTEEILGSDILLESSQQRNSPLILNHRARRLVGPKTVVNNIDAEKHLTQHVVPETIVQHQQNNNLHKLQPGCSKFHDGPVVRKQVRFTVAEEQLHQKTSLLKSASSYQNCSSVKAKKRKASKSFTNVQRRMKHSLTSYCRRVGKKSIFKGIEFLLTGLSSQKERDMEALIRNSGGVVLSDIPFPPNSRGKRSSTSSLLQLPIILCMRKLQTAKFLYGCAVGALILQVDWVTDCISGGTILQPEEYMILCNRNDMKEIRIGKPIHLSNRKCIFERVGIMLHGKHSFCTKLARIIKHGGGHVFKTLQWLIRSIDGRVSVAAIVAEDKTRVSRHLKHCASEKEIPMMPSSWIIKSLYTGKLLPFIEENSKSQLPIIKVPEVPMSVDMSEEI